MTGLFNNKWYRIFHPSIWIAVGGFLMILANIIDFDIIDYTNLIIYGHDPNHIPCVDLQKWYDENHLQPDWTQKDQDAYNYMLKYGCY